MPLRDHFRPPLDDRYHWAGMHGSWPTMIVAGLRRKLPPGFFAEPWVYPGRSAEVDGATFEIEGEETPAPPRPTLTVASDLPAQDVHEVRVYDGRRRRRLVAAVEIVSPANLDRPEHRRAFAAKCAGLLERRISVVIVDVVTTRSQNLYADLLDLIGVADPSVSPQPPSLYACACRMTKRADEWLLEAWAHALSIGGPLPTVPLWLADDRAVPLELEESYEETCRILGLADV